jgi:hypothetical protein
VAAMKIELSEGSSGMAHGGGQRTYWILGRMFRRGSSAAFPLGVIVEFHEFEGRWFVTDQWSRGGGAALRRPLSDAALGKAVLSRMRGTRGPLLAYAAGLRRDAYEWGEFCAEVAGVPMIRYRPEKRLVILADREGSDALTVAIPGAGSRCPMVGLPRWARR